MKKTIIGLILILSTSIAFANSYTTDVTVTIQDMSITGDSYLAGDFKSANLLVMLGKKVYVRSLSMKGEIIRDNGSFSIRDILSSKKIMEGDLFKVEKFTYYRTNFNGTLNVQLNISISGESKQIHIASYKYKTKEWTMHFDGEFVISY